jgi:hypothetical protein
MVAVKETAVLGEPAAITGTAIITTAATTIKRLNSFFISL